MSLVASRGVNKRANHIEPVARMDDNNLIDSIREKKIKINLPIQTKKRLISLLENDQNQSTQNKFSNVQNDPDNFCIENMRMQLDQLQLRYDQLYHQAAAISSVGKIAAILMWDMNLKLSNIEKTINLLLFS
jgi:hypothetical protein